MDLATIIQIGAAASVMMAAWALLSLCVGRGRCRVPVEDRPPGTQRWLRGAWDRVARTAEAVGRRQVPASPEEFGKLRLS
ncbi:MAG: hypothetical protein WKF75_17525 [Singulisphaera sp.]